MTCTRYGTKTVQSKRNTDLFSFELHLILDFVLTEPEIVHGPVKFPARLISHFAMNIIIWLRLTQPPKSIPPNDIFPAIRQNIFPPKFPVIRYNAWTTIAAVCTKQVFLSVTFLPTTPNYHLHACAHVSASAHMWIQWSTCSGHLHGRWSSDL